MRRVLVIEDNDDLRTSITSLLEAKGFEVSAAADGRQGLKSQRKNPADIVVVDLLMPENEGIEPVLELQREFPRTEIIAHAFRRALDTLTPEPRGRMIEITLQKLRDRCMNLPAGSPFERPGSEFAGCSTRTGRTPIDGRTERGAGRLRAAGRPRGRGDPLMTPLGVPSTQARIRPARGRSARRSRVGGD